MSVERFFDMFRHPTSAQQITTAMSFDEKLRLGDTKIFSQNITDNTSPVSQKTDSSMNFNHSGVDCEQQ